MPNPFILYDRLTGRTVGPFDVPSASLACSHEEIADDYERNPEDWNSVAQDHPEARYDAYRSSNGWDPNPATVCDMTLEEVQSRSAYVTSMALSRSALADTGEQPPEPAVADADADADPMPPTLPTDGRDPEDLPPADTAPPAVDLADQPPPAVRAVHPGEDRDPDDPLPAAADAAAQAAGQADESLPAVTAVSPEEDRDPDDDPATDTD